MEEAQKKVEEIDLERLELDALLDDNPEIVPTLLQIARRHVSEGNKAEALQQAKQEILKELVLVIETHPTARRMIIRVERSVAGVVGGGRIPTHSDVFKVPNDLWLKLKRTIRINRVHDVLSPLKYEKSATLHTPDGKPVLFRYYKDEKGNIPKYDFRELT